MDIKKSSGLILHPTALPSKYGIGDIGNAAFEFVNFLEATETKIWQLLPLGLTSNEEFSPYSSPSSLLGNRYLIDLDNILAIINQHHQLKNLIRNQLISKMFTNSKIKFFMKFLKT